MKRQKESASTESSAWREEGFTVHAGKGIDSVWLYLFAHWWSQCLGHRGKVMRSRLFPGHAVRPCPKEEQGKKGRQKEKWGRERRGSEQGRGVERGGVLEDDRVTGRQRERMTTKLPSIQNVASAILVRDKKMYCQLWD